MIIIGAVLFVALFLLINLINWDVYHSTHKIMVADNCKKHGRSNFKRFIEEFNKVEWYRDSSFPESFFAKTNVDTEIHASIIKFNGNGMTLDYISFVRFQFWLRKNKYKQKKPTYQW